MKVKIIVVGDILDNMYVKYKLYKTFGFIHFFKCINSLQKVQMNIKLIIVYDDELKLLINEFKNFMSKKYVIKCLQSIPFTTLLFLPFGGHLQSF